jgi:hypothetical protein
MSILFNSKGDLEINANKPLLSCQWCKAVTYDFSSMRAHNKTKEHLEKKKANKKLAKLTNEQAVSVIKTNKVANISTDGEPTKKVATKKEAPAKVRKAFVVTDKDQKVLGVFTTKDKADEAKKDDSKLDEVVLNEVAK